MVYISNIEKDTLENDNFRKVVFTSTHLQLVLITLQVGESIGEEVHDNVDQFFRVESGEGEIVADGVTTKIYDGTAIVVPAGTKHNIINRSTTQPLKLYTIYAPANHPDGTVHKTLKEAQEYEQHHH